MTETKSRKQKIGLLNFQYSTHNYGAVLQAGAMEFILKEIGYIPKHIDFQANPKITFRQNVGKLLRVLGLIKYNNGPEIGNEEAFERFRQSFISRTEKISSQKEFRIVAANFDSVVVGSDQVWRPEYAKDAMAFFLGYVPDGTNRVSYAASFGNDEWQLKDDKKLTTKIKGELKKFKAISCREDSGVDICKAVFGVAAEHVLDPLLLVADEYLLNIIAASRLNRKEKVVYYKLDTTNDFLSDLRKIAQNLNVNPVNIYLKNKAAKEYREVTDWMYLIYNSEIVVSDSFHCICLGLRFGKEVIYCPNDDRGKARLDSLFNKLGIEVVKISTKLNAPMFKLANKMDINEVLQEERFKSLAFLNKALENH